MVYPITYITYRITNTGTPNPLSTKKSNISDRATASIKKPVMIKIRSLPNFVLTLSYINANNGSVIASKIRVAVNIKPITAVLTPKPMLAA